MACEQHFSACAFSLDKILDMLIGIGKGKRLDNISVPLKDVPSKVAMQLHLVGELITGFVTRRRHSILEHWEGVGHALDRVCDFFDSVGAGIADWLHDEWIHSYPAGHRHRLDAGPSHSATKTIVTNQALAGQDDVFTEMSTR